MDSLRQVTRNPALELEFKKGQTNVVLKNPVTIGSIPVARAVRCC